MTVYSFTFAVSTVVIILLSEIITCHAGVWCSSRDGFTDVGIKKGPSDPSIEPFRGTKKCDSTSMSAKFTDFRYSYCEKYSNPCCITPDNKSHIFEVSFTTGSDNITLQSGIVAFGIAGGTAKQPYSYTLSVGVLAETQYTIRANFFAAILPEADGQNVVFVFNLYDTNENVVLCIEGQAHVNKPPFN